MKTKNILKKIASLVLVSAISLNLAACGGGEKAEETQASTEEAAAVSNDSLSDESIAIAVGQTTVTYKEYKAYYYLMKEQYESTLGTDVWKYSGSLTEGVSLGRQGIESVIRLIIQIKVIAKAAALQKVSLATDEKEEASHSAATFCNSISDDIKSKNGLSMELITQIFEENKLAQKMYKIIIGGVDVNISDAQAKAARVQLLKKSYNEKNKDEVMKQMNECLKIVKEKKQNFYSVAKDNTEEDQVEMLIGAMDSRTNLAGTILAMKENTISQIIDENNSFYIVYCVQVPNKKNNKEYRNQIASEKQNQAFKTTYSQWAKNYKVHVSKALLKE